MDLSKLISLQRIDNKLKELEVEKGDLPEIVQQLENNLESSTNKLSTFKKELEEAKRVMRANKNEIAELYEKRERAAAIAITFAGMCVEAFMYDYAATHLGDNYAKSHTDKLDVCSKILVLPRLACGKEIDKSSEVYSRIKRLFKPSYLL